MNDEWKEFDIGGLRVGGLTVEQFVHALPSGYEYKVTRRKIKSEREQFINECFIRCGGASSSADYGRLYDAGARFK
jgi:hypothetical protein